MTVLTDISVEQRARQSLGISSRAIYTMAAALVKRLRGERGRLCDFGCGAGLFRDFVAPVCDAYVGVDVVRYDSFPADAQFVQTDLDTTPWPIEDDFAD